MRLRPNPGCKRIFDVFGAQGACLKATNLAVMLNEIHKLKQMSLFVNVLNVSVHIVAY